MNHLAQENCNKAKCKSCIFGENPIDLTSERKQEIYTYLATGQNSHICHTTNKTCYGALEFQASVFFHLGFISEPTVECLLLTAKNILGL